MATPQSSITSLLTTYATALRTRNHPLMLSLYTQSAAFLAPNQPTAVGKQAISDAYKRVFAASLLDIEFQIEEVVVMGRGGAEAEGGGDAERGGGDGEGEGKEGVGQQGKEGKGQWAFARTTAQGTKTYLSRGYEDRHFNQELFLLFKPDEKEKGGEEVEGADGWRIARYAFSSMKPV